MTPLAEDERDRALDSAAADLQVLVVLVHQLSVVHLVDTFDQVVDEVLEALASFLVLLATTQRVPLASQLDVAINTVSRAYQELERKGLIISNGRKGTFVKSQISKPSNSRELKDIIISLIQQGHDRKEIEQLFNSHLDQIFN